MFTCVECKEPIPEEAVAHFDESGEWHLECFESWLELEMAYWSSNYRKSSCADSDDAYEPGSYKRDDTLERILDAADNR